MPDFCDKFDSLIGAFNPCFNNEAVILEGKIMNCFSTKTNPAGKTQIRFHQVAHGQGTGSLGNEYVFNSVSTQIMNVNPGETVVETTEGFNNVISKGSAPNFTLRIKNHITITPNGNMNVHTEFFSECRG